MGALATDNVESISSRAVEYFQFAPENLQKVIDEEREELHRRETRFRNGRPFPDVHDKLVILVDDGLATGQTMNAALIAVGHHAPKQVIIAVPVGAPETCLLLSQKANKAVSYTHLDVYKRQASYHHEIKPGHKLKVNHEIF